MVSACESLSLGTLVVRTDVQQMAQTSRPRREGCLTERGKGEAAGAGPAAVGVFLSLCSDPAPPIVPWRFRPRPRLVIAVALRTFPPAPTASTFQGVFCSRLDALSPLAGRALAPPPGAPLPQPPGPTGEHAADAADSAFRAGHRAPWRGGRKALPELPPRDTRLGPPPHRGLLLATVARGSAFYLEIRERSRRAFASRGPRPAAARARAPGGPAQPGAQQEPAPRGLTLRLVSRALHVEPRSPRCGGRRSTLLSSPSLGRTPSSLKHTHTCISRGGTQQSTQQASPL